jgi:phospholipid/cholesterol/gamma-HCH transport system ATP-binding protein
MTAESDTQDGATASGAGHDANGDAKIRVRDLTVGYGSHVVLEGVSFDVPRGRVFVIIGGSGSGKTTLLRHMIGLQEPMSGTIEIAGVGRPDLTKGPPKFGVTFQDGALFGDMTLLENVMLPLQKWTDLSADTIEAIARARIGIVGLGGFEHYTPADLSGGMRKRAGVARALALEHDLLFLDEPTAGLDPVRSAEFDRLLRSLNEALGVTIVLVSHELESILGIGDDCILLHDSVRGIIARGNPQDLHENATDRRVVAFFHRDSSPPRNPDALRAAP